MIGLDTNVLVRYLTQDDPAQAKLASNLIETLTADKPGFVTPVVLVETVRVLESCYESDKDHIAQVVEMLLSVDSIAVDQSTLVWRTLRRFQKARGDFADTLVAALSENAGCEVIYSFDRRAAKRAGMTLLQ